MPELLDEIHPGEILLEEFLRPMGISLPRLAADLDLPRSRVRAIVKGKSPIKADTALRLGIFFGTDARFWMNLQSEYDVRMAVRATGGQLVARVRAFQTE